MSQLPSIATFNSRNGYQSLGRLSDGDGKESSKKAIGLDWQNNKFSGRATRFFRTFLCRRCTDTTWNCPCRRCQGVFTWENSYRREYHTGMTFWFRIAFTWWLGHFISPLFEGTLHVDKNTCVIRSRKHCACATRSRVPADRFHTETGGRFAFTWYRCEISYRSEILAPVQQPGWTHAGVTRAGMTFCGGII